MSTTIHGADVVGESKDAVGVGISTPLQGCFHLNAIFLGIQINDVRMKSILLLIHVGDVFLDTAFVEIGFLMGITFRIQSRFTLITENNSHTSIEVSQLP